MQVAFVAFLVLTYLGDIYCDVLSRCCADFSALVCLSVQVDLISKAAFVGVRFFVSLMSSQSSFTPV